MTGLGLCFERQHAADSHYVLHTRWRTLLTAHRPESDSSPYHTVGSSSVKPRRRSQLTLRPEEAHTNRAFQLHRASKSPLPRIQGFCLRSYSEPLYDCSNSLVTGAGLYCRSYLSRAMHATCKMHESGIIGSGTSWKTLLGGSWGVAFARTHVQTDQYV